jgi:hypothetical protein
MFVLDGSVNIYYKNGCTPILILDEAAYFGEISYLFKTRNNYRFSIKRTDD